LTKRLIETRSAIETMEAGRELAGQLSGGDVVLLSGDLGAGKTTFAQGIARGLGVRGPVQSPTFTLIAEYDAPQIGPGAMFVHVDLYRLDGAPDVESIGFEEYLDRDDVVTVVEWPERASVDLFPDHWSAEIALREGDLRQIAVTGPKHG
jgi:tRNA threonylcarbamoyladenosine biosynthesis protein TsaE